MGRQSDSESFYRILVAIETDATRFYGPNASRPALLGATDSEQMLSHLSADLKALLPDISNCSLIAAGALFDQTQILRPSYPVFAALEAVSTSNDPEDFKPGLVSIGARDGKMPRADLQPLQDIPLGLLQLLPVVIHGPADLTAELGQAMEYRFMEEGQVSAHSAAWLEAAFGIEVNHARMMTLTDLNAMLRMQLDHYGFLPMWELLDASLSGSPRSITVQTDSGQQFKWQDNAVHASFETFDSWASRGGSGITAERLRLAAAYGDWTREVRQYLTTLKAHGLQVRFHLPENETVLEGTFYREGSSASPGTGDATITEHSYSELGTIAVTVRNGDRVENYYPLCPQGLNDIQAHIREKIPGVHTVAFPGTILYDEKTRRLIPDTGHSTARH
ncbi:MAG: hypothetical protein HKN57_07805 [Xanthomonadales bacterium]|nr:hypothetical protein [Gammaproteobacteria bacterium]MBT8052485.1 hypothetical protein [Gammaproteobacteria bacterium]NND57141.1 hypothetical protein [Xanthomonadales bacterium]NNK52791.1 hypothetical protein [Xanthomonadales bacterium]